MSPWGFGHIVNETGRKAVSRIVIAVAVFGLEVGAVQWNHAAVLAHEVQFVSPGVSDLRSQSMPRSELQSCLQGIVVGIAHAVELVDITKRGILRSKRPWAACKGSLVYVLHHR